jgi:hypothetical protein
MLSALTPVDRSQDKVDSNNKHIAALHFVDPASVDELQNLEAYYLKHATVHSGSPVQHAHEQDGQESDEDSD